jgi:hypothetical protein
VSRNTLRKDILDMYEVQKQSMLIFKVVSRNTLRKDIPVGCCYKLFAIDCHVVRDIYVCCMKYAND